LNQVFLFLGGFLLGMFFQNRKIATWVNLVILISGFAIFIFYPAAGDRINLVTGSARIAFTLSCFLICLGFYKTTALFPAFINKPLTLLGEASYSVYLLHPLVFTVLNYIFNLPALQFFNFPIPVRLVICIAITLVFSYFVYEKFEKYFMRLGHQKALPVTVEKS
jgi:peptidoglycan/LPS O-acetylase OafA/YrhL